MPTLQVVFLAWALLCLLASIVCLVAVLCGGRRTEREVEDILEEYLAPLRADAQVEALDELFYAPAYGEVV